MKQLIHIFNLHPSPVFKAAAMLSTQIMTVSRLNYNPNLVQIKSLYPMPFFNKDFEISFEEVSHRRAQQIWREFINNDTINILWSGGIDSTVLLVALLQNRPVGGTIHVYCNLSSITENVDFYRILLSQKDVVLKNSSVLCEKHSLCFITGDLGDQIFGSELLFVIAREFGFSNLFEPYQNIIPQLFKNRCGDDLGLFLYDRYLPIVKECPFEIKTAFDFIWWWNFTQKWQGVKFRKDCLLLGSHKNIHFFDCEEFQLWSLFNNHKKIGRSIETYKQIAKDFIFKFDKNGNYLNKKLKCSSPLGDKAYFFGLYDDGSTIANWSDAKKTIELCSLVSF